MPCDSRIPLGMTLPQRKKQIDASARMCARLGSRQGSRLGSRWGSNKENCEMKIYGRQGDLVIERLEKIDGELTEVRDLVFAGDSSGHCHRLIGLALMKRIGNRTQVQINAPIDLVHEKSNGHKTVLFIPGAYEVRILRERGNQEDRDVAD